VLLLASDFGFCLRRVACGENSLIDKRRRERQSKSERGYNSLRSTKREGGRERERERERERVSEVITLLGQLRERGRERDRERVSEVITLLGHSITLSEAAFFKVPSGFVSFQYQITAFVNPLLFIESCVHLHSVLWANIL